MKESNDVKEGTILPSDGSNNAEEAQSGTKQHTNILAEIAANITQYTERPDLFLKVLEENDPGFIKRMNKRAEAQMERENEIRFRFGKWQAYSALVSQHIFGAAIVGSAMYYLTNGEQPSFWALMAATIFFAVTQGGSMGFKSIVGALAAMIGRAKNKPDDT